MTMSDLIEKLNKEHGSTGGHAVLRFLYMEYTKNDFCLSYRDKIIGYLHGLNATGCLSDDDCDSLICSL